MNKVKQKLKLYLKENLKHEKTFIKSKRLFKESFLEEEVLGTSFNVERASTKNIDEYIESHKNYSDFQTLLFKYIDDRGLKDSDVYNKVHIDRRLFSKVRTDKNYHPSRETVILLAIALELTLEELENLLVSASYSLPKNNKYDLIIRFCFINKIFKITDINDLLNDYNCKLFSY